ncbi:putative S-adenosylmethionine-dependent methyltransferase [Aspergillus chevalieri]|uniref:Methyltransferase type 11 domain-containing protein n=1 Tax=Aspergillus chevalieri TaxID=182096 RepID=A0A7R7VMH5_ASPCH|nr:uncharacterized protein ACHE_31313S [Aspergillus chevalieri]BCR87326.1 hypothetical protein ACHE_31313S [Aspergillus chevalieri]
MASFSSTSFSHARYSTFRPTYPLHLYNTILSFHTGPRTTALDLGTGHALVAREISKFFTHIHATDPSQPMLQLARELSANHPNVSFHQATAEDSGFLEDGIVDLVTAGQAAHWFDYERLWPELGRVVKPGGTVAFWGYTDPVILGYPHATELIEHYGSSADPGLLGAYWQQPGRDIVLGKLRAIQPPGEDWETTRVEYDPKTQEGTMFMRAKMKLAELAEFVRTWSAYHGWQERWPERRKKVDDEDTDNTGDVVDELMERIRVEESRLSGKGVQGGWREVVVELEWGTGLVLARRK